MKTSFPLATFPISSARSTPSRVALCIVAVSVMGLWMPSASAQSAGLWIQEASVKVGQREVALVAHMDNETTPVAGLQLDLTYDPSKITLGEIRRTERTSELVLAYRTDNAAGRTRAVLYSFTAPPIPPGRGPILHIAFQIHQNTGQIAIALEHVVLGDPEARSIPVRTTEGRIEIHPNRSPLVDAMPDTSITVGEPLTLHIQAADPDPGDTLRFSDDSPLFEIDPTGTIQYTPSPEHIGDHAITVMVSDGEDSVQVRFTLAVHKPPNRPPILYAVPDTFAVEDLPFFIRVAADDPDLEDRLVFSDGTGLFDIDTTSGEIRFTPRNSDVGRHHIVIRVSDGQQADSTRFVLTVQNVNDPPRIGSSPLTQTLEDQPYRYVVEAGDEDEDTLTYTLLQYPVGMKIAPQTGAITWEPQNEDVGEHSILVGVSDQDTTVQQAYILVVQNVNDPPSGFALISPKPNSLIRGDKVRLEWEQSIDPDVLDEVQYVVQYRREGGAARRDTVSAPMLALQGLSDGRFQWIVWAVDRSGVQTLSAQTDWTFRIDATPPTFAVGVLRNPVLTDYLDIYAVASEEIRSGTVESQVLMEGSDPTPLTMAQLRGAAPIPIYHADYKLLGEGGTMDIQVRGEDLAGNPGQAQRRFTAKRILAKRGGIISTQDGQLCIVVPPRALDQDTYLILSTIDEAYPLDPGGSPERALPFSPMLPSPPRPAISPVYRLLSTRPMEQVHLQVIASYSEKGAPADTTYASHKIGLYVFEQDTWRYVPSRVHKRSHTVQATVHQFGFYQVQVDPDRPLALPQTFALYPNMPNPFNTSTTIQYELPRFSSVRLDVYDVLARPVTTLIEGFQSGGVHEAVWDGTDAQGRPVASGVYLYILRTPKRHLSGKMLLLR